MREPARHYRNNVANTQNLLDAMLRHVVMGAARKRHWRPRCLALFGPEVAKTAPYLRRTLRPAGELNAMRLSREQIAKIPQ